jgi:hypothetical protein
VRSPVTYQVKIIEECGNPFMLLDYNDEDKAKTVARNMRDYYARNNWEVKLIRRINVNAE